MYSLTLQVLYPSGSVLRTDMTTWNHEKYLQKVDKDSEKYRLEVGAYNDDAGESMRFHEVKLCMKLKTKIT